MQRRGANIFVIHSIHDRLYAILLETHIVWCKHGAVVLLDVWAKVLVASQGMLPHVRTEHQ